jgi:hypothetical protein
MEASDDGLPRAGYLSQVHCIVPAMLSENRMVGVPWNAQKCSECDFEVDIGRRFDVPMDSKRLF